MSTNKCSLLWNHVRVHVDGTVLPCCQFQANELSSDYPEIPKLSDGIDAAFNSDLFERIRSDMEQGMQPNACRKCYHLEKHSINSMRLEFNKRYNTEDKKLRCIKVDTSTDSALLDYYDSDLSELDYIKFVGGEPMIDKNHEPFLSKLFSKSDKDISLRYYTNGTVKPSKQVIEFWKSAKSVEIYFSIDGVGRVNEILRPPHKWETIVDTIEYFKSIECVNFEFYIHTVVSCANIKHLLPLIQFGLQYTGDIPNFDILEYPEHNLQ